MRSARRRTAGSYWALGIACPGRRHAAIASLTSQLSLRRRACPLHAYQHLAELRRTTFDIAPAAIAKVLGAVILVWLWLQLWQLLMLVVIAVVLAIGLEPIVEWLQERGVPRWVGASTTVLLLAIVIAGFFWITGASLAAQAREL